MATTATKSVLVYTYRSIGGTNIPDVFTGTEGELAVMFQGSRTPVVSVVRVTEQNRVGLLAGFRTRLAEVEAESATKPVRRTRVRGIMAGLPYNHGLMWNLKRIIGILSADAA